MTPKRCAPATAVATGAGEQPPPRVEVLSPMGQAFTPRQRDAEQASNLNDIDAYSLSRCR